MLTLINYCNSRCDKKVEDITIFAYNISNYCRPSTLHRLNTVQLLNTNPLNKVETFKTHTHCISLNKELRIKSFAIQEIVCRVR